MKKLLIFILAIIILPTAIIAGFNFGLIKAAKKTADKVDEKVVIKKAEISTTANNRAPVISSLIANPSTISTGAVSAITCSASDADGDILTYTWSAASGTVSGTGATTNWTAPASSSTYVINVTVTDGHGGSAQTSVNVTVTKANNSPIISSVVANPATISTGAVSAITCTASDADGDILTYTWSAASGTISGTGATVNWTAPASSSTYTISVTVSDGHGGSAQSSVNVVTTRGNVSPVISSLVANPTTISTGAVSAVTCSASDADGDTLTYVWSAASGTISGTGATVNWTAPASSSTYVINVTVTDGHGGSAQTSITVPVTKLNNSPTLSWTGETNYVSDGLNPETGDISTSFVYRVKYTDIEGDAPTTSYPEVHIKKGGTEISGSPFAMAYISGAYDTGAIYSYSKIINSTGTDYTYYFEAQDSLGAIAIGAPTASSDAPNVTHAPTLAWTGEANYINDGLDPEVGFSTTSFIYRVKYIDADNDAPLSDYPKVHIKKGGVDIAGSPFTMTYVAGQNDAGAVYSYSTVIPSTGTDYFYYFDARDLNGVSATGALTWQYNYWAPDVYNSSPTLSWTGETNYISDGLYPETGYIDTSFIFRVTYTDINNDAPLSSYPRVHIKKGGVEINLSPFPMTYISGQNNTGAIYTYSKILTSTGTDYTYYFEARDSGSAVASGAPITPIDSPDVLNSSPTLSWTGETNYVSDGLDPETGYIYTSFAYKVTYADINNDNPMSGYPRVHIQKDGSEIAGSPFAMSYVSGTNNTGAVYSYSTVMPSTGTDYSYYFDAEDLNGATGTGVPIIAISAPNVLMTGWTFGGSAYDKGDSVQQTSDGGYIIAGMTASSGAGSQDGWLIKTDSSGNQSWAKTFGGTGWDKFRSVKQTSDGGYIATGYTDSSGAGGPDVWLVKTDASGNQSWAKTFGGAFNDEGFSVSTTSDGGYIIVGYMNTSSRDVFLIKTDSSGNQSWAKTFGGTGDDEGYSVQQTSDGGYIITGSTHSYITNSKDVTLIKTDSSGNQSWVKAFGGTGDDKGYSVQQTSDGGYIITGYSDAYNTGTYSLWLIKTDSSGNQSWDNLFGAIGWDYKGYSVQQTSDGGYIIAGQENCFGGGGYDVWLIKTNSSGIQSWYKTFGGTGTDKGYSVQQTSDGGYIIAGETGSYSVGGDVWLIKTDSSGNAQ